MGPNQAGEREAEMELTWGQPGEENTPWRGGPGVAKLVAAFLVFLGAAAEAIPHCSVGSTGGAWLEPRWLLGAGRREQGARRELWCAAQRLSARGLPRSAHPAGIGAGKPLAVDPRSPALVGGDTQ